jgi:DNA polymerase III epsilon subunit family exonuclease
MPAVTTDATPLEDVNFVALDLETTGIAPAYDHIIEIGAARFQMRADGTTVAGPCFEQLVRPDRNIPNEICALTGIDNDMVKDAPPLDEVWPAFLSFLQAIPRSVIIAHNVRADLGFLVMAGETLNQPWPDVPAYCTFRIAREVLNEVPNYRLGSLVDWLNVGNEDATFHRALADALHTRNLLAACVKRTEVTHLEALRGGRPIPRPNPIEFEVTVPSALKPLEDAIQARTPMRFAYRGGSKGKELRPVTPLGFYQEEEVLYLRGHCHIDDSIKSFRCDRIRRLSATEPPE